MLWPVIYLWRRRFNLRKVAFLFVLLTVLFVAAFFVPGDSSSLIKNGEVVRRTGITVYFFYGQGCPHCARVEPYIDEMGHVYGLNVRRFEVYGNRSNMLLLQDYFERYGVPAGSRGIPIVFTSEGYIEGDLNILNGFEGLMLNSSRVDSQRVEALSESDGEAYSSEDANLDSLSMFAITVAALVDSINPCSMAILFFLLAGLLLLRKRSKALKVGLAFTLSVFVANLMFGFGILTTIAVSGLSSIFKVAAGAIAILTGVLLLKDAFRYGSGGFKMEVPEFLRPYLKRKLSKAFYGKSSSLIGAFLVGFLVTSFEVPCTGGPYFYVLARMADDATRMQTIPLLLYYNLIFVMPLVLITALLYFGSVHVERAREWKEHNKRLIDFARGLPMIAVGIITIPLAQLSQALITGISFYKVLYVPLILALTLYAAYQFLSRSENRSKALKWTLITAVTMVIMVATITTAQTTIRKQTPKTKTTSTSTLEPCPDPTVANITECCILDKQGSYNLDKDLIANGDCLVITTRVNLNCGNHAIIGNGTGTGINITSDGNAAIVRNCDISNFTNGIDIYAEYVVITTSKIHNNNLRGMIIAPEANNNMIRYNMIVNNFIGIIVDSYNNTIYDNYFDNNTYANARDYRNNYWNTTKCLPEECVPSPIDYPGRNSSIIGGPYLGGNYWNDYTGKDLDYDGIGDTDLPYNSNGYILNGGDWLPLVDILSPEYSNIQAPTGSLPYNPSATYEFNITWKDNVQLDKVFLELDGTNYTLAKTDEYLGFDSNYRVEHRANYSISFTGLPAGTHTYRWFANDTRDNWNSTQLFNFTIDNVPPSIEILSPKNITYCNYVNVKLEFTINEAASWIAYSLDHQENITIFTNVEAGTHTKYVYIPNYGSHNIIVYAKDLAGNTGKSERIYFTTKTKRIWGGGGSFRCVIMLY